MKDYLQLTKKWFSFYDEIRIGVSNNL
jgi:hypothetical protein